MSIRRAFTMIELLFVIVVMGIIAKYGVEFLAQAYRSFIFASVNHTLQSNSAQTLDFIASRLQYRIKDSVIVRIDENTTAVPIGNAPDGNYTVLEWVASDIDGFRGYTKPNWSGIIDLDASSATSLISPDTDTAEIDTLINTLSDGNSGINDAALYFIGSNSDVNAYGWNGTAISTQVGAVMHPIKNNIANPTEFVPRDGATGNTNTFAGVDVFEYYKLSWTANAIVYTAGTNNKGTLTFYYDYQPWNGENFAANAKSSIIMENVSTFQFISVGSLLKIQVCTKSNLIAQETYSLCKEKTIF